MIRKIEVSVNGKYEEFDTATEAFQYGLKHFKIGKFCQIRIKCYREHKKEKW